MSNGTAVWETETARVSIFAPDVRSLKLPNWETVTGIPAARIVDRPAERIRQEAGPFKNYQVAITLSPGRGDLVLNPNPVQTDAPVVGDPATMGNPASVFKDISELALKWLVGTFSLQRLALGATLAQNVSNSDEALKRVLTYLPLIKNEGALADLAVMVNRPRKSKTVPQSYINRLAKWSMPQVQTMLLGPSGVSLSSTPHVLHQAQLELDINTDVKLTDIPQNSVPGFLNEFAALALEIAEAGDTL